MTIPWSARLLLAVMVLPPGAVLASAPTDDKAVAADKAEWPQWRGADRDGKSPATGLLEEWPDGGPPLAWTYRKAGKGYSGPAVKDGRLYMMGADDDGAFAVCLTVLDGYEVWRKPVARTYDNGWGDGPRGTPTIDGDHLYVLTGRGVLACLAIGDGSTVWEKDLTEAYSGKTEAWGYAESPLIDGDAVVACPGGKDFMVKFDKNTGKEIWISSGIDDDHQYSSILPVEFAGTPMYVTMTKGGMVACHADTGKFLWRYEPVANGVAVIPTVIHHDGFIYGTSGYGTGCGLVKLVENDGSVDAQEVYSNKIIKNHHGGVVLHDGHLYGHNDGVGWTCQDFMTGERVWVQRDDESVGKGSVAYADGKLYLYGEKTGAVALVPATPDGYKELGRFEIPEKTSGDRKRGAIWTHPVVAEGKLFLRDQELLFAYDVAAQ